MDRKIRRGAIVGVAEVDLPREKLERLGAEALRDEELLAVLLSTGFEGRNVLEISSAILQIEPLAQLMYLSIEKLTQIKGIGRAKAAGAAMLTDIKDRRKEHFIALFFNARNQVICREEVSVGSLNASLVHPREKRHIGHILGFPSESDWWLHRGQ
jgi:DNA repair protein RadC